MRHPARCVRRFIRKGDKEATVAAERVIELAFDPVPGMVLSENGLELRVSEVVQYLQPRTLGVQPIAVELRCVREPIDRLPAALEAGWTRIEAATAPLRSALTLTR
jgi:hypothetical protein